MAGVNQPGDDERNLNLLELEIDPQRFVIRLDNAPAVVEQVGNAAVDVIRAATDATVQVIGAAADAAPRVVAVAAAGYIVYKLANTSAFLGAVTRVVEGLGEAFIEKIRAGSLEITLIAENQQTAETIRQFYKAETLLQQFNIALRKYGRDYNDPQIAFTKIVLSQPENAKVGLGDLESLKKKADEEMKEASINGIKYERSLHKSRNYVEIQTTEKTVIKQMKEIRFLEEKFQHASSRDADVHEMSRAPSYTSHQERRKLEIDDLESVFDFLEIVKTDQYKETSSDQVLDETLMLMMGYFQYYKLYMKNHKFDQVGVVKNKMLKLFENNFVASGDDIESLAEKITKKGNNYEAILFYEISAIFYSRENSLNAAGGIGNCMFGIKESLKALRVKNKAEIKPIACDYVIPVMHVLLQSVQNMNKIEAKERVKQQSWCLYYIGVSYRLVKEYDSSLSKYFEARDLMQKTYGKAVSKYRLYGAILNNIGGTYRKMSVGKEAAKYYEIAIEAAKQATDFPSAERQSNYIELCIRNLSNVSK